MIQIFEFNNFSESQDLTIRVQIHMTTSRDSADHMIFYCKCFKTILSQKQKFFLYSPYTIFNFSPQRAMHSIISTSKHNFLKSSFHTYKYKSLVYYNITKAKRALWLVNSASTICPWCVLLTYSITKAKRKHCDIAKKKLLLFKCLSVML